MERTSYNFILAGGGFSVELLDFNACGGKNVVDFFNDNFAYAGGAEGIGGGPGVLGDWGGRVNAVF